MVAFGVIGLFAIFGRFILDYLHITIEALQVSGGLLLLLVAMQLLTGAGRARSPRPAPPTSQSSRSASRSWRAPARSSP